MPVDDEAQDASSTFIGDDLLNHATHASRSMLTSSMPPRTTLPVQKDLKPSMGRVRRFQLRWSCSTRSFKYLHCRFCCVG
jgi:hypothetical protein